MTTNAPVQSPTDVAREAAQASVEEFLTADRTRIQELVAQRDAAREVLNAATEKYHRFRREVTELELTIKRREELLAGIGNVKIRTKHPDACVA